MSRPFTTSIDIRSVLTRTPPTLDHVLPGLLRGTVGMLAGPGGIGKTSLELQIAMGLATGTPVLGGLFETLGIEVVPQPARVVLVTPEEQADVLAHKLHAVAKHLLRPVHDGGTCLSPTVFLERLASNLVLFAEDDVGSTTLLDARGRVSSGARGLLRAARGARLVILDPLRQFHAGDENDSGAMNRAVRLLRQLAARSGAAVVFAHHTSRAATQLGVSDTSGAARGSTALTDGVRWQLNLSQPTKEWAKMHGKDEAVRRHHVLLDIPKANYLAPPSTKVLRRGPGGVLDWASDLSAGGASGLAAHRRQGVVRRVA